MMVYEIEQDVPFYASGKWKRIAEQMEVGDSVLVANDMEAKTLKCSMVAYYKSKGVRIGTAARNQNDGTFRVWRLEAKPIKRKLVPGKGQTK